MRASNFHHHRDTDATRGRTPASFCMPAVVLSVALSLVGCQDLTGRQSLPDGMQDPRYYNNATGALGMRNAAVFAFSRALPDYIVVTGLLSDELTNPTTVLRTPGAVASNGGRVRDPLDERRLVEGGGEGDGNSRSDATYSQLQFVRATLQQALGQLATYDTSGPDRAILPPAVARVLRGELYALYGLTEIQLADLFCSGIPLSTLDFQKDFTYRAGSTTAEVYRSAVAKFDTALALSGDSVRITYLARVGLGRAYLNLGQLSDAVAAVTAVPTDYTYQLAETWPIAQASFGWNAFFFRAIVAKREGGTGLPYAAHSDPRTADTTVFYAYRNSNINDPVTAGYPRKYVATLNGIGMVPLSIVSGVEARLIEAEAALRANDPHWLTILNTLRTTGAVAGTYTRLCQPGIQNSAGMEIQHGSPCPSGMIDTTWSAGTGMSLLSAAALADIQPVCPTAVAPGVPCSDTVWNKGLRPLVDPGTDSARVATIFRERAAWLYLTGHRQGDLRRQLRQYAPYWPDANRLYPTGTYLGIGVGTYGTDVTAPIPSAEYINPLFRGCLNRAP